MMDKLSSLLESLNFTSVDTDTDQHICNQGFLQGVVIKFSQKQKDEMSIWKRRALEVEGKIKIKKKKEIFNLREKVWMVEERIKKRQSQKFGKDLNHNNSIESLLTTVHPNTSLKHLSDDLVVPSVQLSLESINFKEISSNCLNDKQEKSQIETPSVGGMSSTTNSINEDYICNRVNKQTVANSINKESVADIINEKSVADIINQELIANSINKDPVVDIINKESMVDLINEESIANVSNLEVVKNIRSLHILQQQQNELDIWYEDMKQQLELEQICLKEKYEELKLGNIRKQEQIIDTSEEVLKHSLIVKQYKMSLREDTPSKSYLPYTKEENILIEVKKEGNIINEDDVAVNMNLKQSVKRLLPTPPAQRQSKVEILSNSSLSLTQQHNLLPDCFLPVQKPSPVAKELDTDSLGYDSETLLVSNATNMEKSKNVSFSSPNEIDKTTEHSSLQCLSELETLRDRRKSRPIRFFNTPVSDNKRTPIRYCNDTKSSVSSDLKTNIADTFKSPSSSTPHEEVQRQLVHDFSPVYADVSVKHMPNIQGKQVNESREEDRLSQVLPAVAKGFLTRRLLKTNQVQDIIKTIKDAKKFLSDIDKENLGKKHMSHADKQLRTRLQDELWTKHQKLHDIFFNMAPQIQMKLLELARLQTMKKKTQKKTKDPVLSQKNGKKLSTASQRSIKRRQENLLENQRKPKTAPDKLNSGKKSTLHTESRALKPIQSWSSPVLSDKVRSKSSAGSATQNRYSKKPTASKKLNMNSLPQNQRVMAANLNKRHLVFN